MTINVPLSFLIPRHVSQSFISVESQTVPSTVALSGNHLFSSRFCGWQFRPGFLLAGLPLVPAGRPSVSEAWPLLDQGEGGDRPVWLPGCVLTQGAGRASRAPGGLISPPPSVCWPKEGPRPESRGEQMNVTSFLLKAHK